MMRQRVPLVPPLVLLLGALAAGCQGRATGNPPDLDGFRELARAADCAQLANRLFLIDNQFVFWDRQGDCPDNSYRQALYGRSAEALLCERHDSIAGPIESCPDPAQEILFGRILENLDQPDLGLGPDREVSPISF